MKETEIQAGKRYRNKTGNTERLVLRINSIPRVRYKQIKGPYAGNEYTLSLSSFARWAASEATERAEG